MSLVPQTLFGLAKLPPEFQQTLAADVLQLNAFEVLPDPFVGVEIGSVEKGKLFKLHPRSCSASQKLLYGPSTLDGRAVPDYQELALDPAQEVLEETHHVFSVEGALLLHHVEPALKGDAADHREMIAGELLVQDGRLAHRRA